MSMSAVTKVGRGEGWPRANLALAALFLGAFVVGSAELVVVGILNILARDLGVSVGTAGTLVTAYALGIAVGGPVLGALSVRFGRRLLLAVSLTIYVLGNVVAVVAVDFGLLLVARIVTGLMHGLFVGVALAVAAGLVPPERAGRAISVVLGGIAVSTVLGVPLGTFIGQAMGWRAAFVAVVVLGIVALVSVVVFVPPVENAGAGGFAAQARHALAPRVLVVLGVGFLLMGGQFAALTYLAPFLEGITGISGGLIGVFLLAYGITNAVGTFVGGWAADRDATATLVACNVALIFALGALYLVGSAPILVVLALGLWGLVGFGLVPSLQYRAVALAGPGRDLAAILPASAVNAGIAAGALGGGWAVANIGASAPFLVGTVICAVVLPATWATRFFKAPAVSEETAPNDSANAPTGAS